MARGGGTDGSWFMVFVSCSVRRLKNPELLSNLFFRSFHVVPHRINFSRPKAESDLHGSVRYSWLAGREDNGEVTLLVTFEAVLERGDRGFTEFRGTLVSGGAEGA